MTDRIAAGATRASLDATFLPLAADAPPVEWVVSDPLIAYPEALAAMEARAAAIAEGTAPECVWLLEHPPLYTAGTSARPEDLVDARFPVYETGRGGQFTYHGPGQRVAYVMLDLKRRAPDVRRYVSALEAWIIGTLSAFNVTGERREDRVGVWVRRKGGGQGSGEDKIAAIGIRVRRWVTFHGISLNVEPDLSHFGGIVPCGVREHGVTSLADLGLPVAMHEVDAVMRVAFEAVFGKTVVGATLLPTSERDRQGAPQ
ncbi:lipoyl(octanoyl) transferase LipB [Xanthobacter sp. AM11]|uniref:lipoyl(octanoyl) transferase LipB n=1 Tax=Xanthobacter sp. AM11 TaxID=3380643 RepID=UPI0039BF151B